MALFKKQKPRPRKPLRRQRKPISLLTGAIVLFQVSAFALIAFKDGAIDAQALLLAVAMPALCAFSTLILPKFCPCDRLLMALMNFLCGVSVVVLYSMLPDRGLRQACFYACGLVFMVLCASVVTHLRAYRRLCWLIIPVGLIFLALPLALGEWDNGAKAWVSVPFFGSFQPSELVKLMLVVVLSYFFSAHRTIKQMLPALLFTVGCLGLLFLQRDLGTALMYYFTTIALFYAASSHLGLTLLGLGGGVAASVLGYQMFSHVKVRVAMWRNPWSDALGKGWQIIQALLAIGSGGLFGLGLGLGQPRSIPAYYTDFIFAVICEQFGILFGLCVIAVYMLIIVRGVTIALRSRRSQHALLALGCTTLLGVQTFVIIAGVIKMIPLTGVTMPFMSYGGSSLISCMGLMGFLQGVSACAQNDVADDIALYDAQGGDGH